MPLTDAEYGRFQRPDDVCPFCYGNNVVLEEEEYSEGETMAESDPRLRKTLECAMSS